MLTKAQFAEMFAASCDALRQSEDVTRRELRGLSRSLLGALHGLEDPLLQGDIQFINRLIPVLTPINRKVYVVFMQHFGGFHFDEALQQFTKKSAKRYAEARQECVEFLADPNNNLFSWGTRHIEVNVRPFDPKAVTKYIEGQLKKAAGAQLGQDAVIRAVFDAGIKVDVVMGIIAKLAEEKAAIEGAQKKEDAPF